MFRFVIVRYAGPKVDLFLDGVLVDEEWPMSVLRPQSAAVLEIGSPEYRCRALSVIIAAAKLNPRQTMTSADSQSSQRSDSTRTLGRQRHLSNGTKVYFAGA